MGLAASLFFIFQNLSLNLFVIIVSYAEQTLYNPYYDIIMQYFCDTIRHFNTNLFVFVAAGSVVNFNDLSLIMTS